MKTTTVLKFAFALPITLCAAGLLMSCVGDSGGSAAPPAPPAPPASSAPGISASPSTVTFAAQTAVASSAPQVVTVTNTGNAALSTTAVTITGTDAVAFSQTNGCSSIVAPGASCTISVTYTPGKAGAASATLSIASNATASPSTIALSASFTALNFSTFQPASVVIGAPNMTTAGTGAAAPDSFIAPYGNPAVSPAGTLYIADNTNSAVLGYNSVPRTDGASADFVLGQPNLYTGTLTVTAQGSISANPTTVLVYDNHLLVADFYNNRILIWNSLPTTTGALPDVVLGQAGFTTNIPGCTANSFDGPQSMAIANGNLVVADQNNNRVLIYQGVPATTGAPAIGVLGQADFMTCTLRGTSASNLHFTEDVGSDGTHLIVADMYNNRVLIWNTTDPTTLARGQAADMVLGQTSFLNNGSGMTDLAFNLPSNVAVDAITGRMAIVDFVNSRVLLWDRVPTCAPTPCVITTPANAVLGQIDFTSANFNAVSGTGAAGAISAYGLEYPYGATFNGPNQLIISDERNNRVLIYNAN
jgi:hypothetical protein